MARPFGHPVGGILSAKTFWQFGCQQRGRRSVAVRVVARLSAIGFLDDRDGDTATEYVFTRVAYRRRAVPLLSAAFQCLVRHADPFVLGGPPGVLLYP